jgi:hypothetical protein
VKRYDDADVGNLDGDADAAAGAGAGGAAAVGDDDDDDGDVVDMDLRFGFELGRDFGGIVVAVVVDGFGVSRRMTDSRLGRVSPAKS